MFKKIAITLSAAGLVTLAIALAPAVPTALAIAPTVAATEEPNRSLAEQSCVAFETWFLEPACTKAHTQKAARARHHVAGR
jgi:hypothetical protein